MYYHHFDVAHFTLGKFDWLVGSDTHYILHLTSIYSCLLHRLLISENWGFCGGCTDSFHSINARGDSDYWKWITKWL